MTTSTSAQRAHSTHVYICTTSRAFILRTLQCIPPNALSLSAGALAHPARPGLGQPTRNFSYACARACTIALAFARVLAHTTGTRWRARTAGPPSSSSFLRHSLPPLFDRFASQREIAASYRTTTTTTTLLRPSASQRVFLVCVCACVSVPF